MERETIPVYSDWRLNEEVLWEAPGVEKQAQTAEKYGEDQVHLWRRSYDVRPPAGEALKDTAERTLPFFRKKIVPLLEKGKNVLISAHETASDQ